MHERITQSFLLNLLIVKSKPKPVSQSFSMNYNILYFAFVSNKLGGVEQKILAQFDALKAIHPATYLYLVSTFKPGLALEKEISKREGVFTLINSEIKNPLLRRKQKFDMISRMLESYSSSDTIVYLRYPGADYFFLKFLKKNEDFKFVTEHQEIENKLRIGILNGKWLEEFMDFLFGKPVRKNITGFVAVSSQYLAAQKSYLNEGLIKSKFFLVNGNGINTRKFNVRKIPSYDGRNLHILFVGSVYKSHGLHRLAKSLIANESLLKEKGLNIYIHIAGSNGENTYLNKYLKHEIIRNSFIFYGFLQSNEIDLLADKCHIAINSLGTHRIGQYITSTLKSREYFARGIPYITSSSDDDFDFNNPFIKMFPANEDSLNIREVVDFAKITCEDLQHNTKMRKYAETHLDWKHKMKKLKVFFDQIVLETS